MPVLRRQATLFLDDNQAVESVRGEFNPLQARLIGAHVTIVREDETDDWDRLGDLIVQLKPKPVRIDLSEPKRDGNFVWCAGSGPDFADLRAALLAAPRVHDPHLTLIHPRNGVCTDEVFADISWRLSSFSHLFREISFIEQSNGGPWRIWRRFRLQLSE